MTRALITIHCDNDRYLAAHWCSKSPTGTRIEFKATKRTVDQNSRMWAMLTEIATQKEHCGRKYTTDGWKAIFMHALGREMQFLPSLDEQELIPIGYHSSDLSKEEMSDLIDLMHAWGAEHGVKFHEQDSVA